MPSPARKAASIWGAFRNRSAGAQALVWLVVLGFLVILAAAVRPMSVDSADQDGQTDGVGPGDTPGASVAQPSTPAPVPSLVDAPTISGEAAELLRQVRVAEELDDGGYDRGLFSSWVDADGDGCNTRCEVLAAERIDELPGLPASGWRSVYDGMTTDDPSELDIDHVVALREAWRSGAATWDPPRRAAFA
ncbi:MAG: hypothetical protein ACK4V6_14530, partial [Microthrixaceae bacterium]